VNSPTSPVQEFLTEEEKAFWRSVNLDEILNSDVPVKVESSRYLKYQSKAGQTAGLSFILNPELNETFCSSHNGYGFRVKNSYN
jgi:hypothetical protein